MTSLDETELEVVCCDWLLLLEVDAEASWVLGASTRHQCREANSLSTGK